LEVSSGTRWQRLLDTTRIADTSVAPSTLEPPAGWRKTQPARPPRTRKRSAQAVPAHPFYYDGPLSHNPQVSLLFWGSTFAGHQPLVDAMSHAFQNMFSAPSFIEPLLPYEVGPGHPGATRVISDDPPAGVGSTGYLEIAWFVITHRWGYGVPAIWWKYYGLDPFIAMLVDQSKVDSSSWGGYHAAT